LDQNGSLILFLVNRNILAGQTKTDDFKPFGQAIPQSPIVRLIKHSRFSALYQAVTGCEEEQKIYNQFSPDLFDLVIVERHGLYR
jgi:type I restriction enzyme R subunit